MSAGAVTPAVGEERRMMLGDRRAVVAEDLCSQAEGCIVPWRRGSPAVGREGEKELGLEAFCM